MEGEDEEERSITTFLIKKKSLYSVQEILSGDFCCNSFIFYYLCTPVITVFSLLFSYVKKASLYCLPVPLNNFIVKRFMKIKKYNSHFIDFFI